MLESCDIVGVNPLEWLTHVLNNLHNDTPPSKSSNCYHTTTKISRVNPREIFSSPAGRLVSDAYSFANASIAKDGFYSSMREGHKYNASDFESLDAAFKRLAVMG